MTGEASNNSATPSDASDPTADDAKELKSLDTYLKSLPYGCESTEEMQEKLRVIVEKLYVCVHTNSWAPSVGWDHMLQYWLIMRYPLPHATRAALAKIYYQLIVSPGSEPRLLRGWVDMLGRLVPRKQGSRPKLPPNELELDWRSLWIILKKQVWASASDADDSLRTDSATYLTVAALASPYFPPSDIHAMLDEMLSLYSFQSATTVITIITSFLPPYHSHLYLPILFRIWESINSAYIDERMLEISAALVRERMNKFCPAMDTAEEPWGDVGIFSDSQWARISRSCLVYMNIPIGPRSTSTVSTTGSTADTYQTNRLLKKGPNAISSLPTIFVYSIALDGPIASLESGKDDTGYVAGSKALTSLRTIISSVETYFHPSNHGNWSTNLATFLSRISSDFATRWHEEHQPECQTPIFRRLSTEMKREFVETLKTPALLAMFSKDPICTAYAQSAIKYLAALEPPIMMPAVLERSYNGLESVNETHRVTAVLGCLASVAPMIVSEKRWLGGQKHILPLLELTLPGIDINDPTKVCALAFIASALSEIKIGDLTQMAPLAFGSDAPGDVMGDASNNDTYRLPDGFEEIDPKLDVEDERALTRDSTAAFPDCVVAFVRRLLAVFEALPEEGGKSNKTGGKLEETLLKSIKSTMDVVFQNLSDHLFDLILGIVCDYATTTSRANAVRAFGSLISSLTKANAKKVIAKLLPRCAEQIRIELEHGASSIRTTSTGLAIPSDTSLHWHMAILRAIVSSDGSELVPHKAVILDVIKSLASGTKNERGFSGTGRIVGRILASLTSTYPKDQRFLNRGEWSDPRFCRSHNQQWGRLYRAEDVCIDWHVPSAEEISFAMQILDEIVRPSLNSLDKCLDTLPKDRDAVWRNDFCRMLHVVRSAWGGLSAFILLPSDDAINDPYLDSTTELAALTASSVRMNAGFCVDSPGDPRYGRIIQHRDQFGSFLHRASLSFRSNSNEAGEEHIDAMLAVIRAIDTFLLDYAMSRTAYASSKKSYEVTRDVVMTNSKQKHFPRSIWVRRAQVYHASRVHTHSLYRRRSPLEELLIVDLLEFSLSSYTRARKNAQAALIEAVSYFVRSARLVLERVLSALEAESKLGKQADPDKQKGALHLLWNRSMCSYAMITPRYVEPYFRAIFTLRTQEKPSIQKLVGSAMDESIGHITAEAMDTSKASFLPSVLTKQLLEDLKLACSPFEPSLLSSLRNMVSLREQLKTQGYDNLRVLAMDAALDTGLHWKYQHWALVLLVQLIRRDEPTSPDIARIFVRYIVSDHPSMRHAAQRGLVKVLRGVKARTLSPTAYDLWLNQRQHPLRAEGHFSGMEDFASKTWAAPENHPDTLLVDHTPDSPLIWQQQVQGYKPPPAAKSAFSWEPSSEGMLTTIKEGINSDWLAKLVALWSQEGDRSNASTDLRMDNIFLIKQIAKIFEGTHLHSIFSVVDEVLFDTDKFKQRAAAEVLTGLIRGAKHFPASVSKQLWDWFTPRLPQIFAKLTLDTLTIWQSFVNTTCSDRDPRRIQPIVDFIFSLKIDFQSESVFPLSKSMEWMLTLGECLGPRFSSKAPALLDLYFENLHTPYAEIRQSIIATFLMIMGDEWRPEFPDSRTLLLSCISQDDPLLVKDTKHEARIMSVVRRLPTLRSERLPGANVSQSLYDKIGLTLLSWIWTVAYSPSAPYVFVYTKPILPEIFRMSELQDSAEVQQYSSGVLYIMAAINPPADLTEPLTEIFLEAVKASPSWRVRHKAIPVLAVWYFRNLASLSPQVVRKIIDVLVECLRDENVEVRETAATTLSGILRCRADKEQVMLLKDQFARTAQRTRLPKRDDARYPDALRKLHAAILGMIATLQAYPYVVEPWMPSLIERLSRHSSDPQPVSSAVRKFAGDFKKTHQDTWHIDKELFDEDQLQALQTIISGTSYYA